VSGDRKHIVAVRERLRGGGIVTQAEYASAVFADTTRADLDKLAKQVSRATGVEHRVWRTRNDDLVVYSTSYRTSLDLRPA
jgi:hypothetical protein